jgi:glycosidase
MINNSKLLYALLTLVISWGSTFAQPSIERVEPPFWWTEMVNNELQLLVYGKDIGHLEAELNYPGVILESTVSVENPNYLFLNLLIQPNAQPGSFDITFLENKKEILRREYSLKAREEGSALREGFDTSDVMYLITPDRFANGDPTNDDIEAMKEKADRDHKGGRHGGDIAGIDQHMDYIAEMGFTAVWVNPVLENDMPSYSYHGYAATDFYKVDARFGSNEEYRGFCEKAADRDIKVIMDMIMNHCGSAHWFVLDPPSSDWINFDGNYVNTNHRRQTVQDIHASEYDKKLFEDGWFVSTMPDLNQDNPFMAKYLIQNTIWWIEYSGISGIRMDTYPYPDKYFMTDWTCAVMEEYPYFNIVGEEWSVDPAIVAYWQQGKVNPDGYTSCLPSVMDFPNQHAVSEALTGNDKEWGQGLVKMYEMMAMDFLYADPDNLVVFPDNHDMDRFYTQVNEKLDLYKMGIAYMATTRGIPQIYYGTEILMTNRNAPGDHGIIRTDFPGGWEGDEVNGFTGKGLNPEQKEASEYMKKLLNWRKDKTSIHNGRLVQFAPENAVYAYFRFNEDEKIMVIFNKNEATVDVNLAKFIELLPSEAKAFDVIENTEITLSGSLELEGHNPIY